MDIKIDHYNSDTVINALKLGPISNYISKYFKNSVFTDF